MKKMIMLAVLALATQIHAREYDPADGRVNQETRAPWVSFIGHSRNRLNKERLARPKAFRIRNNTGHQLELTIDYNVCLPNRFIIEGGVIDGQRPRMDVWKQGGCIARHIYGSINLNGKWVAVVGWSGTANGAFGAQFEVNLNNQGSATVRFLRNSHVSAP